MNTSLHMHAARDSLAWTEQLLQRLVAPWHAAGQAFAALSRRPSPPALTPTQEANRVREMAFRLQRTDPGFAADLFAAADRHERLHLR